LVASAADATQRALVHAAAPAAPPRRVCDFAAPGGAPATLTPLVSCGDDAAAAAPLLRWSAVPQRTRCADFTLEVLCYAPPRQLLSDAVGGAALRAAVRAQLACAASALRCAPPCAPRPLHFAPPSLAHTLTVVYALPHGCADADADAALLAARTAAHARWLLPPDRPLLRLACALPAAGALSLTPADAAGLRLRDPHLRCAAPAVAGASVHSVSGSYLYYHYKQDKLDDAGWGCAYRSCQTLLSWFSLQAYISLPSGVPSHSEIQAHLVRMGDKGSAFLNSKQWIGAVELMFILLNVYDISCKLVTVARGADVPQHCRALAAHFDSHGTPVMIGGGVLAYTLLGVAYNELTGECLFLILDPHYIGAEDIGAIVPQWCGWKTAQEVFVPDAFYNFCCPQRPRAL
jgi:hypothetical protein